MIWDKIDDQDIVYVTDIPFEIFQAEECRIYQDAPNKFLFAVGDSTDENAKTYKTAKLAMNAAERYLEKEAVKIKKICDKFLGNI